jgi:hypothetical protein
MNTKLLKGALGNKDGDYIALSNQWGQRHRHARDRPRSRVGGVRGH